MSEKNDLFTFADFDETKSEHIAAPRYSYWKSVWRTFVSNKFIVAVCIVMLIVVIFAMIQPMFSHYDPLYAPNINDPASKFLSPSKEHLFGTDIIGRDLFDAVWAGAKNSLIIGFGCTIINMVLGIVVGAIWGF